MNASSRSQAVSRNPLVLGLTLLVTMVFAMSACGGLSSGDGGEDGVGQTLRSIVNGTPHQGHTPVGIITAGGSLCTATLVGKFTVITAAHCVTPGRSHYFIVGKKPYMAKAVHRHPQYGGQYSANNDVAVVILRDAPPVKPAGISTRAPKVGQTLTLLGYGATEGGGAGSGVKRIGSNIVAHLSSTRIFISGAGGSRSNLCFGDSGGPTFAAFDGKELQVGIHSTIAGDCGIQGHDMRVDVYTDWIRSIAGEDISADGKLSPLLDGEAPRVRITEPADGAEIWRLEVEADVKDNEEVAKATLLVDGEVTHEQTTVGGLISFPRAKLEPGEHTITIVAVDTADNTAEQTITVVVREPLPFGEPCEASDNCGSELCVKHPAAGDYCSQLCEPKGESCPGEASCVPASGDQHACGPPPALLASNEPESSTTPPQAGGTESDGSANTSGGCAVGDGSPGPQRRHTLPAVLMLLGLLLRRRTR